MAGNIGTGKMIRRVIFTTLEQEALIASYLASEHSKGATTRAPELFRKALVHYINHVNKGENE